MFKIASNIFSYISIFCVVFITIYFYLKIKNRNKNVKSLGQNKRIKKDKIKYIKFVIIKSLSLIVILKFEYCKIE